MPTFTPDELDVLIGLAATLILAAIGLYLLSKDLLP